MAQLPLDKPSMLIWALEIAKNYAQSASANPGAIPELIKEAHILIKELTQDTKKKD